MSTLAEFHTIVKNELNKGSSLDSYIPDKVRQAAKFLEQNYNFSYMKVYQSFSLVYLDTAIDLPDRFKSINWIYLDYTDAAQQAEDDFRFLKKVDGTDVTNITTNADISIARPTGYWIDGNETIRFDAEIGDSAGVDGKIYYNRFSSWPASPYSSTPDILDAHELLLLYQTMIQFAPFIRNIELQQQYKQLRDDALAVATSSEKQAEYEGSELAMQYR